MGKHGRVITRERAGSLVDVTDEPISEVGFFGVSKMRLGDDQTRWFFCLDLLSSTNVHFDRFANKYKIDS